MKKLMLMLVVAVLATSAQATTVYSFDATRADWYSGANAMTVVEPAYAWVFHGATTNGGWTTTITNEIHHRLLRTGGTADLGSSGQGAVPSGADWVAPAGEIITKVELMGYFRSDQGTVRYQVRGGATTSTDTVYALGNEVINKYGFARAYGGYWGTGGGLEVVDIDFADGVTMIQLNPYVLTGGVENVVFPLWDMNYKAAITGVDITTEPVPEPATMALLGLGGLLLRRRKA